MAVGGLKKDAEINGAMPITKGVNVGDVAIPRASRPIAGHVGDDWFFHTSDNLEQMLFPVKAQLTISK